MGKSVIAFLMSLLTACFRRQEDSSFLRKVTVALFLFHVALLGSLFLHVSLNVHVHSPITGEVIHVSVDHDVTSACDGAGVQPLDSSTDEDACEIFNEMLRSSYAFHGGTSIVWKDDVEISSEIVIRRLDIVYRSTRLLHDAPKNSPPVYLG